MRSSLFWDGKLVAFYRRLGTVCESYLK